MDTIDLLFAEANSLPDDCEIIEKEVELITIESQIIENHSMPNYNWNVKSENQFGNIEIIQSPDFFDECSLSSEQASEIIVNQELNQDDQAAYDEIQYMQDGQPADLQPLVDEASTQCEFSMLNDISNCE